MRPNPVSLRWVSSAAHEELDVSAARTGVDIEALLVYEEFPKVADDAPPRALVETAAIDEFKLPSTTKTINLPRLRQYRNRIFRLKIGVCSARSRGATAPACVKAVLK
jgi:hypothetical protein